MDSTKVTQQDHPSSEKNSVKGPAPAQEWQNPYAGRDMDVLLKEFFSEVRQVDRDNEVTRIIWAFKINPYEQLNLRFDASPDDVRRQYRKLSLLVHPDKCMHPQAREAFEILGEAQKYLMNEERRKQLQFGLDVARDEIRKEWKKKTKHDSAVRIASALHEDGMSGIAAQYEATDAFHQKWKEKARDVLARTAWRKQRLEKRIREEETRLEIEEKEERAERKAKRKHQHEWEKQRSLRVGTWRDFMNNKKSTGKKKSKSVGELKPPQLKTQDAEKPYVQRCAVEQFRPTNGKTSQ